MRLLLIIAALACCWWLAPAWWPLWLLGIAMSPGCSCCSTCTIVTDTFGSNDLATNWTTAFSGSWSISGGTLTTASTSAYLINTTTHPASTAEMSVSCSIQGASGDIARIYAGWKDSTHYFAGEVKFGSSGYLKLFNGTTLVTTTTRTIATGTPITFTLCIIPGETFATFKTSAGGIAGGSVTFASGMTGAGVGTGSTAASLVFDNFSAVRTDNNCPNCSVACTCCETFTAAGKDPSGSVQVDIAGFADCNVIGDNIAANVNGTYLVPLTGCGGNYFYVGIVHFCGVNVPPCGEWLFTVQVSIVQVGSTCTWQVGFNTVQTPAPGTPWTSSAITDCTQPSNTMSASYTGCNRPQGTVTCVVTPL